MDRPERAPVDAHAIPIGEHSVGGIACVERLAADPEPVERKHRTTDHRCPGRRAQRPGGRAVIAVRVGDEDGRNRAAVDGGDQRGQMIGVGRAGVENRKRVGANQVNLCPRRGIGRRIGREQPRDPRLDIDQLAIGSVHRPRLATKAALAKGQSDFCGSDPTFHVPAQPKSR